MNIFMFVYGTLEPTTAVLEKVMHVSYGMVCKNQCFWLRIHKECYACSTCYECDKFKHAVCKTEK